MYGTHTNYNLLISQALLFLAGQIINQTLTQRLSPFRSSTAALYQSHVSHYPTQVCIPTPNSVVKVNYYY